MDIDYRELAEIAVEFAEGFDVKLDYTEQSIQAVDEILGMYSEHLNEYDDDSGKNKLWIIAMNFGIYIGETLLKNGMAEKGFKWVVKDNLPVLRNDLKDIECSPITRAHKRIMNGSEDSIVSFYVMSLIASRMDPTSKKRRTNGDGI